MTTQPPFLQTSAVAAFQCLGNTCEDTCCTSWGMQITQPTLDKYKAEAPELLDAVEPLGDGFSMRRDPTTGFCVKFEDGWCGIHRERGASFLGDACHFFPRITRALGDQHMVTATISCPEVARLMLFGRDPFTRTTSTETRLPTVVKQYLPQGLTTDAALAIHDRFVDEAANPAYRPEINLLRAFTVAQALDTQPVDQWDGASSFYFRMAEGRIPQAQAVVEDPFHLVHALHGLIIASGAQRRARLTDIRDLMADALGISLSDDAAYISTEDDAPVRFLQMASHWKHTVEQAMQPVLTRYLQTQLNTALFPFAGLGANLSERMTLIAVRFATIKTALMAQAWQTQVVPQEADTVRIIQTLSRFLDHLSSPEFSMNIYREIGWIYPARLRALLMV